MCDTLYAHISFYINEKPFSCTRRASLKNTLYILGEIVSQKSWETLGNAGRMTYLRHRVERFVRHEENS